MDNKTVYLKITDFSQAQPIQELLNNHKSDINHSHNLIIDVRVNYGGMTYFIFQYSITYLIEKYYLKAYFMKMN
ncbi:S41 family peptidase [Lysinibacillus sp. NPDC093692]|uniref:S41 family peptidase n=1 Tax=Lysinibacillus sp. NPDC093692 TaxID=3390578 RepID=UPI003CFFE906